MANLMKTWDANPNGARSFDTTCPEEWQAHVCEVFTQLELHQVNEKYFKASITERRAGSLQLAEIVAGGQIVRRGKRQIASAQADHCYLLVQKSGECVVSSEQYDLVSLGAGDAVLVDAQSPYLLHFEAMANQVCITVPNDDLRLHAPDFGKALTGRKLDGSKSVSRVLAAAIDDLQATAIHTPDDIDACVDLFYQVLTGCFKREAMECLTEKTSKHIASFNSLMGFIAENYNRQGLTVADVADELGVSVRTFQRLCFEQGTTFRKLVLNSRLTAAAHALRQRGCVTESTITEISYKFGFSDLSHFSRSFKSKFGASPAAYLKSGPN